MKPTTPDNASKSPRLDKQKTPAPPAWAWVFAVACFAIPVVALGGAVPAMIGVGGGMICLAIARRLAMRASNRIVLCGAVVVGCWAVFLTFAVGVSRLTTSPATTSAPPARLAPQTADPGVSAGVEDELGALVDSEDIELEGNRRRIYKRAISTRNHVEFAEEQRARIMEKGMDTSGSDEQIARLREMDEKHREFIAHFYKISRTELEDVINEGDRKNWPR